MADLTGRLSNNECAPVLLIAWRRPDKVEAVINAIRGNQPGKVFVFCDGSRSGDHDEYEKVSATRALIRQAVDWPCELKTLFSDQNLGCRHGPIAAISWFFDNNNEGIILEDDCVPHPEFLPFCTLLLDRFREDLRIWCVSGTNFQKGRQRGSASYYFSHYAYNWGWASWRRCWHHYDHQLNMLPKLIESGGLHSIFSEPLERIYWQKVWTRVYSNPLYTTWDYQWFFSCMVNSGLSIVPNINLVTNLGFGTEATHTQDFTPIPLGHSLGLIKHPELVLRDRQADDFYFKQNLMPRPSLLTRFLAVKSEFDYRLRK